MSIRIGIGLDIFSNRIDSEAQAIYDRIIAIPNGFSNLSRLNFFVKGLKAIYGSLSNVPVCYDAHWIGGVLGSGVGATAGQACARLCSLTVAGDAVQATASAQPLLLTHGGASSDNYYMTINTNNNCSTTTNTMASITTNFFMKVKFSTKSISTVNANVFITLCTNFGITVSIVNGKIRISNTGGFYSFDQISLIGEISDNTIYWLKMTGTSSNFKVEKSLDSINYTTIATVTPTSSSFTPTGFTSVIIGNTALISLVNIYSLEFSATEGSVILYNFNPAQYTASTSQTQWTSSTGEVWTINTGTANSGYKGVLVSKTIIMSDGVDDTLTSTISGSGQKTQYFAIKMFTYTNWLGGLFASNNARGGFTVSANKLAVYAGGASVAPFGTVSDTKLKQFSFLLGTTATNWEVQENGNDISNGGIDIGTNGTFDNVTLFSRGGGVSYQNMLWNTYILSNLVDNTTTKTATYNLIRSLNNNAF